MEMSENNHNSESTRSNDERNSLANAILGSESFMWLMAGANHPEAHLSALRPAYDNWVAAGGKSYGKR
jgi:hypothetical protein